MMNLHQKEQETLGPHDLAAKWLLLSEAGGMSSTQQAQLQAWIEADPSHRAAWNDVRMVTQTVAEGAADLRLMKMRTAALAARPRLRRRDIRAVAAAWAGLAILGGAAIWVSTPGRHAPVSGSASGPFAIASGQGGDPRTATYRTAVGVRSVITLPDGSVATLDTDSAIQVAYTDRARGLRLLYGQALLDVAKHKATPFEVYAVGHRITAVGTKFDVRITTTPTSPRLKVALLQGIIKVTRLGSGSPAASAPSVTMAAGEVLEAGAGSILQVTDGDVEGLASWRSGMLTFDDAPLGAAVEEMNRYTTRPITIADPKLAKLRLSGVFPSGDAERFVADVAQALPVRVSRRTDGGAALVSAD